MKRRILHIVPTLARAGTGTQLAMLARATAAEGFDVHVCAIADGGPMADSLRDGGIESTVLGSRWTLDPQTLWRLRRLVARLQPAVIHSWTPAAAVYGHAAARLVGVRRHVVGLRGAAACGGRTARAVLRHVGQGAARIVANHPAPCDRWAARGMPAEKIRVIDNGVEPSEPSAATRGQLLGELGLGPESRLVGFVGPLVPSKRGKDAIWAADLLKVIRDDVHLLVFGDGPHRTRLEMFRDQVVIRDTVHLLGHRNDLSRWLPHLDVFWSATGEPGRLNAVLEAMAAAVPVVAAETPGTRDLITQGESGYLVPVGDRAGLARWANKLLDDRDLAVQMGTAGRRRVEQDFAPDKMVRQYVSLYEELFD